MAHTGANCVLISALTQNDAALVTEQVARAMPRARMYAWSSLAESTYTDPDYGGIPAWLAPRMVITVATLAPAYYPRSGRRFLSTYALRYGPPPPYAIFGYEAMSLMLNAISRATDHGSVAVLRSNVLSAIFNTHDRESVLGTYSIDANGDTSLNEYGVYHVSDGQLVFWKAVAPEA
jgi:branched-chain amino acid transport system substrate-binding protein